MTGTSTLNHFANAGFADHPATITKTYTYQGPVYDNRERQFVGFKSVQEVTQGDGVNAKVWSGARTTFATDACTPPVGDVVDGDFGCTVATTDYSLYHAIRGLPNSVETSQVEPNGAISTNYTTVENDYTFQRPYNGLDGRGGISVQTVDARTFLWDEVNQAASTQSFSGIENPIALQPRPPGSYATVSVPTTAGNLEQTTTFDLNGNRTSVTDYGFMVRV